MHCRANLPSFVCFPPSIVEKQTVKVRQSIETPFLLRDQFLLVIQNFDLRYKTGFLIAGHIYTLP